jgi:hypothetical protein
MNKTISDSLSAAFIGAVILFGVTYASNSPKIGPEIGSIITALPIGLVSMFFFRTRNQAVKFGFDAGITNILVLLAYLTFDIVIRLNKDSFKNHIALISAFIVWAIGGVILYYTHILKK